MKAPIGTWPTEREMANHTSFETPANQGSIFLEKRKMERIAAPQKLSTKETITKM